MIISKHKTLLSCVLGSGGSLYQQDRRKEGKSQ
nr:MAG TPA: hypothetical protein [Caudoviricetes sp.]